jgi:hypothetical protein
MSTLTQAENAAEAPYVSSGHLPPSEQVTALVAEAYERYKSNTEGRNSQGSRSRPELVRASPDRKMLICSLFRPFLLNSGTRFRLPPRRPSWPSSSSMSSGCKPFSGRSIT